MNPIVSPYKTFRFVSYAFDHATGEASLVYAFDDALTFTEKVKFPVASGQLPEVSKEAIDRALFALHLVGGISYYKAYLAPEIIIESGTLNADEAAFWTKLYTLGLGEFFYRNDLDFKDYIQFPSVSSTINHQPFTVPLGGAIVPIGGGKDSLVAIEMLRKAGKEFDLVALGAHERIAEVAQAVGKPLTVVERALDPLLFELNKKGALNGHVPISAFIAFTMTLYALLHGKKDVVLSNERSANVGNVKVGGVDINHQYSKGLEFERDIQQYIASSITPSVRYFSLLRPLSELAITKMFVENGKYFDVFSSCNKNFKILPYHRLGHSPLVAVDDLKTTALRDERPQRWCGTCPKCAFVFSMLAAFMPKEQVVGIFGKNLYEDAALLPTYKELLAVEGIKPFECVGEPEEVFAAFALAFPAGEYRGSVVMDWFEQNVSTRYKEIDSVIFGALAPSKEHAMPSEYAALLPQK